MPISFPASPTVGQVYTSGKRSWTWDGTTWASNPATPLATSTLNVSSSVNLTNSTSIVALGGSTALTVDSTGSPLTVTRYSTASVPTIRIQRSKTATLGQVSPVTTGDHVGYIFFNGANNLTGYNEAARIVGEARANYASAQGGALTFWTTSTSGVATERMRIDENGLITGSGTSLGAWTAFTPGLSGVGWALGNGTAAGVYVQIGKICHFRASITFGNTSTFGSQSPAITGLPLTMSATDGNMATAQFLDSSAVTKYGALPVESSTTGFRVNTWGTNGVVTTTTSTVPFAWASGDVIYLAGTYQVA